MQVTFFNSAKRRNSTRVPTGGTAVECYLKEDCSILNPTFIIGNTGLRLWTSCYVPDFNRYYFVDDITSLSNNRVEVKCSIDVLATYKSQINNSTFYIERAQSEFDEFLEDNLVLAKSGHCIQCRESRNALTNIGSDFWDPQTGCYILTVTGGSNAAASTEFGVTSYAVTAEQLMGILNFMYTDDFVDFLGDSIAKAIWDPFKYIVSLKWLPIKTSAVSATVTQTIYLGPYPTDVHGRVVNNSTYTLSAEVKMPDLFYDDFRNYSQRFTSYQIYVPGCGSTELNRTQVEGGDFNSMSMIYSIDILTGNVTAELFAGAAALTTVAIMHGSVGVDVQIGQNSVDVNAMVSGTSQIAAGAGMAIMNPVGAAMSAVSGIGQIMSSIMRPSPAVLGVPGDRSNLATFSSVIVYAFQLESTDPPIEDCGRPLMKRRPLSAYSGYVKCLNASIDVSAFESERTAINDYLNGGVFLE